MIKNIRILSDYVPVKQKWRKENEKKTCSFASSHHTFLLIAGCDGGSKPEPSGSEPAGSEDPVDTTEPPDVDTSPTNINLCIASEPETLDPNMVSSVDGATYTQHTFEGLMKYVATGETVGADGEMKDTAIDFGQAASYEPPK